MHFILNIIRWIVHKLGILLLANAIVLGLPLLAITSQITQRDVVKSWLADTNTYETLRTESFNLIQRESSGTDNSLPADETLGEIFESNENIDQTKILQAVEAGISAEYLQEQLEIVIDAVYDWLSGETSRPIFVISLNDRLPEVQESLTKELTSQIAAVPECDPGTLPNSFDLITAECIPRNVDLTEQVDDFVEEFAGEDGFLAEATLSGDDLLAGGGGTDTDFGGLSTQDLKNAQTAYSGMKALPWLMLVAGVFGAIIIMFSAKNWKRGMKEIGSTVLSGTIFTFIVAVVLARARGLSDAFLGSQGDASDTTVQAARRMSEPLVREIVGDISLITAYLTGVAIVAGFGLVVLAFWFEGKKKQKNTDDKDSSDSEKAKSKDAETKKEASKQSKPDKPKPTDKPEKESPAKSKPVEKTAPKKPKVAAEKDTAKPEAKKIELNKDKHK